MSFVYIKYEYFPCRTNCKFKETNRLSTDVRVNVAQQHTYTPISTYRSKYASLHTDCLNISLKIKINANVDSAIRIVMTPTERL